MIKSSYISLSRIASNSLVDLREMVSLTEIGRQRSCVAHTLECRVHEACVAKVTESGSPLRNFDLYHRLLWFVFDNDLLEYCYDLLWPRVVLVTSCKCEYKAQRLTQ